MVTLFAETIQYGVFEYIDYLFPVEYAIFSHN